MRICGSFLLVKQSLKLLQSLLKLGHLEETGSKVKSRLVVQCFFFGIDEFDEALSGIFKVTLLV